MIAAAFDYERPTTLAAALELLGRHGDNAKVLAGGHSLIPAMKLRLAQPAVVIDLGRVSDLRRIFVDGGGGVLVGAMATHHDVLSSDLLSTACPLLPAVAPHIGDVQVRNAGTIGGSLVHADPAADWPAAILALDAVLEVASPSGRRNVKAADFFVDLLQSAVQPNEILCGVRVPETPKSVAYVKTNQKASGFALCGVAVVVDSHGVRVGVTGVGPKAYRASAVEAALRGAKLTREAIISAAAHAADDVTPLGDIHASSEYRAHLAQVNTARAIAAAAARA